MEIDDIVRSACDLHLHVGPEILPRRCRADEAVEELSGKLRGCVLKSHFYPAAPLIPKDTKGLEVFAGLVLNNFCGGLNPEAIYASALIAPKPLFVWLPTLHAEQFLRESEFEIPPEWTGRADFPARKSSDIEPIRITPQAMLPVLQAVKEAGAVLCTGHVSWQEAAMAARQALDMGIEKIILTHPIYRRINMPLSAQKELAQAGCFVEHCYSMASIDGISMKDIAAQINEAGAGSVVLSSDVGQPHSPPPDQALRLFAEGLLQEGVSLADIKAMMVDNPGRILFP